MSIVISVENISKSYKLGQINTGTFTNDLQVWWARARGKPNPLLRIGQEDHGNRVGKELLALKDVSFKVDQGEVLGIIGRNGAGKSTLLKILSRVTAPTSGQVKLKGRIASLLEVGTGFHPDLTGRENIYLNGAILGMTKEEIRNRFDEIVAFAEIEKFIDTPVKRYSSGMFVRLAFAVAAHLESEIMLVDEVLAVGDAEFQQKCLGKMGDVAKHGRTVLFVSHNMAAVEALCKSGLLFNRGYLQLEGNISAVVGEYMKHTRQMTAVVDNFSGLQRTGSKRGIIKRVILTNQCTGELCSVFAMNETMTLTIETEFIDEVNNPTVGVYIYADNGIKVSEYRMHQSGISVGKVNGCINFRLVISPLVLYPRGYVISVWISNPMSNDDYDYIREAIAFEVCSSVSYTINDFPSAAYGIVHLPFKWEVELNDPFKS